MSNTERADTSVAFRLVALVGGRFRDGCGGSSLVLELKRRHLRVLHRHLYVHRRLNGDRKGGGGRCVLFQTISVIL